MFVQNNAARIMRAPLVGIVCNPRAECALRSAMDAEALSQQIEVPKSQIVGGGPFCELKILVDSRMADAQYEPFFDHEAWRYRCREQMRWEMRNEVNFSRKWKCPYDSDGDGICHVCSQRREGCLYHHD